MEQKQTLLAADHAANLLTDIRAIYRHELPLLNVIVQHEAREDEGTIFSRN